MEFPLIRCHVEVEVTAKQFVRAFTAQHHLDAHGLDFAGHEVHRSGCADGGDIIGLDVADHFAQGVETFLDGEVQRVVHRADGIGHFLGCSEVR